MVHLRVHLKAVYSGLHFQLYLIPKKIFSYTSKSDLGVGRLLCVGFREGKVEGMEPTLQ